MSYTIYKTTSHTTSAGVFASTPIAGEQIFPTYVVTSDGSVVGASNALHVQPGTGATWAVSAASLPLPSGAATSANQATEITHLATLAGSVSGTEMQVDIVTMPTVNAAQSGSWSVTVATCALPSGAATSAKQDTEIGYLTTIAGAITLGKMQVDVISSALPTGAATSAKQDTIITSLSSIDGHVDGVEGSLTSIDAKITACNTGAVVVSSSALPTGAATAARQDTGNTSLSSIDGKLPALGQALAAASVPVVLTAAQVSTLTPLSTVAATQSGTWNVTNISGTVSLPTGAATSANQSTANTSLASIDGKLPALGQALAAASVPVVLTAAQLSTLTPVSTVTANQGGTWTVGLSAGTNGIGKLTSNSGVTIGAVELAASQTLATVTTVTTCSTVTTLTGGGVAHDGADSGNPIKVGAKAVTSQSGQTAVASGDRTDLITDLDGSIPVKMACHADNVSGVATATNTTDTSVVAAQGASTYFYCTGVSVVNTGSSTTLITLKDGSGGSALWYGIAPAGGGYNFNGGNKALFRTSANTALYFAAGTASTTVYCSVTGYKSKV